MLQYLNKILSVLIAANFIFTSSCYGIMSAYLDPTLHQTDFSNSCSSGSQNDGMPSLGDLIGLDDVDVSLQSADSIELPDKSLPEIEDSNIKGAIHKAIGPAGEIRNRFVVLPYYNGFDYIAIDVSKMEYIGLSTADFNEIAGSPQSFTMLLNKDWSTAAAYDETNFDFSKVTKLTFFGENSDGSGSKFKETEVTSICMKNGDGYILGLEVYNPAQNTQITHLMIFNNERVLTDEIHQYYNGGTNKSCNLYRVNHTNNQVDVYTTENGTPLITSDGLKAQSWDEILSAGVRLYGFVKEGDSLNLYGTPVDEGKEGPVISVTKIGSIIRLGDNYIVRKEVWDPYSEQLTKYGFEEKVTPALLNSILAQNDKKHWTVKVVETMYSGKHSKEIIFSGPVNIILRMQKQNSGFINSNIYVELPDDGSSGSSAWKGRRLFLLGIDIEDAGADLSDCSPMEVFTDEKMVSILADIMVYLNSHPNVPIDGLMLSSLENSNCLEEGSARGVEVLSDTLSSSFSFEKTDSAGNEYQIPNFDINAVGAFINQASSILNSPDIYTSQPIITTAGYCLVREFYQRNIAQSNGTSGVLTGSSTSLKVPVQKYYFQDGSYVVTEVSTQDFSTQYGVPYTAISRVIRIYDAEGNFIKNRIETFLHNNDIPYADLHNLQNQLLGKSFEYSSWKKYIDTLDKNDVLTGFTRIRWNESYQDADGRWVVEQYREGRELDQKTIMEETDSVKIITVERADGTVAWKKFYGFNEDTGAFDVLKTAIYDAREAGKAGFVVFYGSKFYFTNNSMDSFLINESDGSINTNNLAEIDSTKPIASVKLSELDGYMTGNLIRNNLGNIFNWILNDDPGVEETNDCAPSLRATILHVEGTKKFGAVSHSKVEHLDDVAYFMYDSATGVLEIWEPNGEYKYDLSRNTGTGKISADVFKVRYGSVYMYSPEEESVRSLLEEIKNAGIQANNRKRFLADTMRRNIMNNISTWWLSIMNRTAFYFPVARTQDLYYEVTSMTKVAATGEMAGEGDITTVWKPLPSETDYKQDIDIETTNDYFKYLNSDLQDGTIVCFQNDFRVTVGTAVTAASIALTLTNDIWMVSLSRLAINSGIVRGVAGIQKFAVGDPFIKQMLAELPQTFISRVAAKIAAGLRGAAEAGSRIGSAFCKAEDFLTAVSAKLKISQAMDWLVAEGGVAKQVLNGLLMPITNPASFWINSARIVAYGVLLQIALGLPQGQFSQFKQMSADEALAQMFGSASMTMPYSYLFGAALPFIISMASRTPVIGNIAESWFKFVGIVTPQHAGIVTISPTDYLKFIGAFWLTECLFEEVIYPWFLGKGMNYIGDIAKTLGDIDSGALDFYNNLKEWQDFISDTLSETLGAG